MAAAVFQLGTSGDGTEIDLNYDDVTLLATSLTFIVAQSLANPLIVNMTAGGTSFTFQAPPSANPTQFTFATPLQGVTFTQRGGQTSLDFGITEFGFATKGAVPTSGNTIIHTTPHG